MSGFFKTVKIHDLQFFNLIAYKILEARKIKYFIILKGPCFEYFYALKDHLKEIKLL